jgi:hypothetical protein
LMFGICTKTDIIHSPYKQIAITISHVPMSGAFSRNQKPNKLRRLATRENADSNYLANR